MKLIFLISCYQLIAKFQIFLKAFANHLSANIKLSKTQLLKMIQLGRFLGKILGPLLKTELPLTSNVIKPLTKSVLITLGLNAAASAADAGIHKKYRD